MTGDFERPLNARGRHAAPIMAAWLASRGWHPELVLCSTAARTRETLELTREILAPSTVQTERSLYLASAQMLRRCLRRIDDAVSRAMIIAHNPGLEDLAHALDRGLGEPSSRLRAKFPTAAMAWFRVDIMRWRDCFDADVVLVEFMTPGGIVGDDPD